MTRYIAVASGKGGVGKTVTAVNLAAWLNLMGHDITLVDANLSSPSIALHLGMPQLGSTLHDVLQKKSDIKSSTYIHASGIKVVPSSMTNNADTDHSMIGEALLDLYGKTRMALIDTASGSESGHIFSVADEAIIVTTLERPSLLAALKAITEAEKRGCTVIGVLVNQARYARHEASLEEVKSIIHKPILGIIPEDIHVKKSVYHRHPLAFMYPDSMASSEFKKVAEIIHASLA